MKRVEKIYNIYNICRPFTDQMDKKKENLNTIPKKSPEPQTATWVKLQYFSYSTSTSVFFFLFLDRNLQNIKYLGIKSIKYSTVWSHWSVGIYPTPPPPPPPHTWKGDIKAFVAHGKVRYEAKLHAEVPKEACFNTGGQHWAREPSHRVLEAAVFDDGKVIVILLQMERVKHQMDTCKYMSRWRMIKTWTQNWK